MHFLLKDIAMCDSKSYATTTRPRRLYIDIKILYGLIYVSKELIKVQNLFPDVLNDIAVDIDHMWVYSK